MLVKNDKKVILKYAKKYKLKKVVLFGTSKEREDANDIDIGIKGLSPALFFKFWAEVDRDLSKPVDVIDLNIDCPFNRLIEKEGMVLYG